MRICFRLGGGTAGDSYYSLNSSILSSQKLNKLAKYQRTIRLTEKLETPLSQLQCQHWNQGHSHRLDKHHNHPPHFALVTSEGKVLCFFITAGPELGR